MGAELVDGGQLTCLSSCADDLLLGLQVGTALQVQEQAWWLKLALAFQLLLHVLGFEAAQLSAARPLPDL